MLLAGALFPAFEFPTASTPSSNRLFLERIPSIEQPIK